MNDNNRVWRRISATLLILAVDIVGLNIPLYRFDGPPSNLSSIGKLLSGVVGGQFDRLTLFTLGIGPFMMANIFMSVLTMIDESRRLLFSERQRGMIQLWITLITAILWAVPMAFSQLTEDVVKATGLSFSILAWVTGLFLVAGAMLLAWLASMNSVYGVGGTFILILPGIIHVMTKSVEVNERFTKLANGQLVGLLIGSVIFIVITTWLYTAEYRLPIQRTGIDTPMKSSYIAFRVLVSGTMPLMFVSSLFYFPDLLIKLFRLETPMWQHLFNLQHWSGIGLYAGCLFVLSWAFGFINVGPNQLARRLQEAGDYIIEVRPGIPTERYISKRVHLFSLLSGGYLTLTITLPLVLAVIFHQSSIGRLSTYLTMLFIMIAIIDFAKQDVTFLLHSRLGPLITDRSSVGGER